MLKRIRQFRAIQSRKMSTASSPYDNYTKLRAIPFYLHPEFAKRLVAPMATLISTNNYGSWWSSLGALVPFLNIDFLRPTRFSAVYFPAWFVTGEVEANVTYKGIQVKESVWFDNTYIPGSHMAVLSAAPLKFSTLMEEKTVPFTKSLLHQFKQPVQCIPFSTSPFSVLDVAASHFPSRSITINEDLSIDPSSVKPNLISAYPVLLPLYLAQYEMQHEGANDLFTFIIQAHKVTGFNFIMCESISKLDEIHREGLGMISKFFGQDLSGEATSIFPEPRVSISDNSMPQNVSDYVNEWLEELLRSSKNIEILADSSLGVLRKGDEDLRMREMASEGTSLEKYKEYTRPIMGHKKILNALIGLDSKRSLQNFSHSRKLVEDNIKDFEAERARVAPKWWSEWLALNRPELENTDQNGDKNTAGTPPPKDSDKVDRT